MVTYNNIFVCRDSHRFLDQSRVRCYNHICLVHNIKSDYEYLSVYDVLTNVKYGVAIMSVQ